MERLSVIGLDIGRKRVGVAGCDGLGMGATGITTVVRKSFREDVIAFAELVRDRQATALVVGLPYTMDGAEGKQAASVRRYADRLSRRLNLPLYYVDERLSSIEAEEAIQHTGRSPSRHKPEIDRRAAAILLQRWLDQRRR
ncbi:MAG: Holliday junction resolvase RuvX [Coleofasciculaceae cyanobacterium RL_1_1]|nr:Holliday junction resolvase RuvX [Coleofasciculaceae cyanobacterium RL_1_1]